MNFKKCSQHSKMLVNFIDCPSLENNRRWFKNGHEFEEMFMHLKNVWQNIFLSGIKKIAPRFKIMFANSLNVLEFIKKVLAKSKKVDI